MLPYFFCSWFLCHLNPAFLPKYGILTSRLSSVFFFMKYFCIGYQNVKQTILYQLVTKSIPKSYISLTLSCFEVGHSIFFYWCLPPDGKGGAGWEVHRRLQYPARHYPHLGRGRVATFTPEDILACITMER